MSMQLSLLYCLCVLAATFDVNFGILDDFTAVNTTNLNLQCTTNAGIPQFSRQGLGTMIIQSGTGFWLKPCGFSTDYGKRCYKRVACESSQDVALIGNFFGDDNCRIFQCGCMSKTNLTTSNYTCLQFLPCTSSPSQPTAQPTDMPLTSAPTSISHSPTPAPSQPSSSLVNITGSWYSREVLTMDIAGPLSSENDAISPFLKYRVDLNFTNPSAGVHNITVPAFFAADGNAANTSATSGNIWRARFRPAMPGQWFYAVTAIEGPTAAVDGVGSPIPLVHGLTGAFTILESRGAKGSLRYVGSRYLQFDDGTYFLKTGADSPENLLAYYEFDGTENNGGMDVSTTDGLHHYDAHVSDWRPGDPTWGSLDAPKGYGIIGAINYLASKGQNTMAFLTYNYGGDGNDVWPFSVKNSRFKYDCSKLDQWEIVFTHMESLGMHLNFKLQETENDNGPNGLDGGNVGFERKLYYRELIARFAHHSAVSWNLGEENSQTTAQQQQMAAYVRSNDPYGHNVVIHTYPSQQISIYDKLIGNQSDLTGISLQTHHYNVHADSLKWIQESETTGRAWVVANDEQGQANNGIPPDAGWPGYNGGGPSRSTLRMNVLWGNLMAGGSGIESYFGYQHPDTDISLEDFRSRDSWWDMCRYSRMFFMNYLPFWDMNSNDELLSPDTMSGYVFAQPGNRYAIYLSEVTECAYIDLRQDQGIYLIRWFDPRNGGPLQLGTRSVTRGNKLVPIGNPPTDNSYDWVVLLIRTAGRSPSTAIPDSDSCPDINDSTLRNRRQVHSNMVQTGDIKVQHISAIPTRVWVSVPIPYKDARNLPEIASFLSSTNVTFPAIRGTQVGLHTIFYDVHMRLPSLSTWSGTIIAASESSSNLLQQFHPSNWVMDDIFRLIPHFSIKVNNDTFLCISAPFQSETATSAHQIWKSITRCGPMAIEFWGHVFSGQDMIEWQLLAVHSNPLSPLMQVTIKEFSVTFGEFIHVDDKLPLGISDAVYNSQNDTWTIQIVDEPMVIGDAQGLPIIKGALLCVDNSISWDQYLSNYTLIQTARIQQLIARTDGAPLVARDWNNKWLAFQSHAPASHSDTAELDTMFIQQSNMMNSVQHLFVARKLGLHKYAGSSGMQQDFGAAKGAQAVFHDIRAQFTWHYHIQESLRPIHYREASGIPTTQALQPGWVTWSQVTHWHCGVSTNRLGKPCNHPPVETHGWSGKDDQHKSSNALSSAVASFDWPAHRALLRDELNVAHANVRFLPGQSPGAARAVGRRMQADANAFLLTGDEYVWQHLVMWHAKNAYYKSIAGVTTGGYVYRAQDTGFSSNWLVDENGNPVTCFNVWQHGVLLKGLTAAWSVHLYRLSLGMPSSPEIIELEELIRDIVVTMTRHMFAFTNGHWQVWNFVAWNNGNPIPAGMVNASAETPGWTKHLVLLNSAWFGWIYGGMYYLSRANHEISLPQDVVDILESISTEWETQYLPTADIVTREYFARGPEQSLITEHKVSKEAIQYALQVDAEGIHTRPDPIGNVCSMTLKSVGIDDPEYIESTSSLSNTVPGSNNNATTIPTHVQSFTSAEENTAGTNKMAAIISAILIVILVLGLIFALILWKRHERKDNCKLSQEQPPDTISRLKSLDSSSVQEHRLFQGPTYVKDTSRPGDCTGSIRAASVHRNNPSYRESYSA